MTPAERLALAKAGDVFTFAADEPLGAVVLPFRLTAEDLDALDAAA